MVARYLFAELELGLLSVRLELCLVRHPSKRFGVLNVALAARPLVHHVVTAGIH